ncbi:hypothetical protein H632_c1490p0 [Helicosporidium sp. ATCC 50920]|nr:hypothetical protein H632_c1490p0 [Helicosporidium sp. ATCC 50920]|eukprot:KDD74206.1 hypothetical protein H632_c1490p0 [Helicosporidium sp. ATCC 50920]
MSAGARDWYAHLGARGVAREVAAYAAAEVSPRLAALEFERLERTRAAPHERFEVDWSAARRTITASMEIEAGQRMDLLFKLPPAFPLLAVSAECVRRLGASPQQVRRWLLGIEAFLRASRKSVADAVVSWRDNLDAKFEGLEDCLICYSILQPATGALPKKECRTCRKRFHGGCLFKWFNTSGQSTCPHCQSIW